MDMSNKLHIACNMHVCCNETNFPYSCMYINSQLRLKYNEYFSHTVEILCKS